MNQYVLSSISNFVSPYYTPSSISYRSSSLTCCAHPAPLHLRYATTMIQGFYLCQVAASFASNATALAAQGCNNGTAWPNSTILNTNYIAPTYCNASNQLNGQSLLDDTFNAIDDAMSLSNLGWQGYLWRNFDFSEPVASINGDECLLQEMSVDVTDVIMAPPGKPCIEFLSA